jgi:hypothetical protein
MIRTMSALVRAPPVGTADSGTTMVVVPAVWVATPASCGRSAPRMAARKSFGTAGLLPNSTVYGPDWRTPLPTTATPRSTAGFRSTVYWPAGCWVGNVRV